MNKYLFASFILLFVFACQSEQKPVDTPPAIKQPAPAETAPKTTTNPDGTVHVESSNDSFLMGMWEYVFAAGSSATTETSKYKGRWIRFNRDNTFTSGWYDQQTNQGTYDYEHAEEPIITLNYEKEEPIPRQWRVQIGNHSLLWKGGTPMNKTGLMVKVQQTNEYPKKE